MTNQKQENNYKVYVHTCKENGKSYVGLTKQNPKKRWNHGRGYKTQLFYKSIQKYGWDNFEHKIIADNLTAQEASDLEKEMIEKLQSHISLNGYNIEFGGVKDNKIPKKSKTVPVYQFDVNYNLLNSYNSIKEASEKNNIQRSSIISSCKRKINGTHGYIWRYQKDVSDLEEFKNTCNVNLKIQPIYQFDKKFNFIAEHISIAQASRDTGINKTGIYKVCNGKANTAGNYVWKFKSDIPNLQEYQNTAIIKKKKQERIIPSGYNVKVDQYDINNNFIRTWDSFINIEKELNIKHSNISKVCKYYLDPEKFKYPLGRKSAGGYIWKYHNVEEKKRKEKL